jgi:hypothetical protein
MAGRLVRGIAGMAAAVALTGAAWVNPEPTPPPATATQTPTQALEVAGWTLAGGRLTLLFRGTEAALDRLKSDGRLAVEVHWLEGDEDAGEGPVTELPVGSPNLVSALAGEVKRYGFFTWHSWAQRRGSSSGAVLTWPDGTPVPCLSQQQQPCRLSFNAG